MQTLVLWALLAKKGGGGFQKDIRPVVKKRDREALVRAGLMMSEKRGRAGLWLEVTDKGWAWAADHLDADLPQRSTAGSAILQGWLTQIKTFMSVRGLALADILAPQTPPAPPRMDFDTVRVRVRKAYLDLTDGRFNRRALLRDLRDKLQDIERGTLDEALKRMHLEEGTTLSGWNN